jgi:hypothetical protein
MWMPTVADLLEMMPWNFLESFRKCWKENSFMIGGIRYEI